MEVISCEKLSTTFFSLNFNLTLVFLFGDNNFLFLFTIFLLVSISLLEFLRLLSYREKYKLLMVRIYNSYFLDRK